MTSSANALLREVRRARTPLQRVVRAQRAIEQLRAAEAAVVVVRDEAIRALHAEGLSYADIADIAGVTRGRVAQITHEGG